MIEAIELATSISRVTSCVGASLLSSGKPSDKPLFNGKSSSFPAGLELLSQPYRLGSSVPSEQDRVRNRYRARAVLRGVPHCGIIDPNVGTRTGPRFLIAARSHHERTRWKTA